MGRGGGGGGAAGRLFVSARRIAVEAEADLVVAGASFAGCAAALGAARRGARVVLVEPRTCPGYETAALYRPWMDAEALHHPPALLAPWIGAASRRVERGRRVALHPDTMKRGLEDVLLAAGVRLLYASQPVGVIRDGGRLAGVVVAGKWGRRAVLARAVADATEWGLVARLAGERFEPRWLLPDTVRAARTIEFTGCDPKALRAVPEGEWREGFLGPDHRLLEAWFDLALPSADLDGLMAAEIEARRRTVALVERLKAKVPGLRGAAFTHASYELGMASPWILARGPRVHSNLAVLSSAAEPNEAAAMGWFDPVAAARAGEAAAAKLAVAARKGPRPVARRCVAECGVPAASARREREAVRELGAPRGAGAKATVRVRAETIPVLDAADVVVAGGGTAGAVAAPVASGRGARTILVEMHSGLGGTGTIGGVNTYWYGFKNGYTAEVDCRYRRTARRVGATPAQTGHLDRLPDSGLWHVEAKMHALLEWSLEAGVKVRFRTTVAGTLVRGRAVAGVLVATPDGLAAVRAAVTVESTGDGDVAAHAGGAVEFGSRRDGLPLYWSLPPAAKPGVPTNSFAGWARVDDPADLTRAILAGRRRFMWWDHGPYLAPRESRHVTGSARVTLRDEFVHRRHADVVCLCHDGRDIKGQTSADWAWWGLDMGKVTAEIPYRAVVPVRLDGLVVGGKAYSASHEGLALARMQSDMQNLGGATGTAAAMAVRARVAPRRLPVKALQRALVADRALPRGILRRRALGDGAPSASGVARLVAGLTGRELNYAEDAWTLPERAPQPVALVCAAGRRALPALAAAYGKARGERRLLLARLLAWNGSRLGSRVLLDRLAAELAGGRLPELSSRHAPPPPDGTGMPLACRLLYTLGLAREPRVIPYMRRVAEMLDGSPRNLARYPSGAFYYTQAICLAAERLGRPEAVPALAILHAKPGLHGLTTKSFQPGVWDERSGYLEVAIGRAMARCGSPAGARILARYLGDARAYLAAHARAELVAVTGRDLGRDPAAWRRRLARVRRLAPRPWLARGE